METYTLTANDVKLEVFRDLMEELQKVRESRGQSENAGNSEVLDTLEAVFENCFNKAKEAVENS